MKMLNQSRFLFVNHLHAITSSFSTSFRIISDRSSTKQWRTQLNQIRRLGTDDGYEHFESSQKSPDQLNQQNDDIEMAKRKTKKLLNQQEKEVLSNLGLDKYSKLFEDNQRRIQAIQEETRIDRKDQVRYFKEFLDNREFQELKVEDFEQLIDSEGKRNRITQILRDYEIEKYNSSQVPTTLTINDMKSLLKCESERDIIMHFNFMFKREGRKFARAMRREIVKKTTEERLNEKHRNSTKRSGLEWDENGAPMYAKWKNTLFISFSSEALRKENDRRIRDAILFGPRCVLDFGYGPELFKPQSFSTLTTQIYFMLSEVMDSKTPFHLNFCGFSKTAPFYEHLVRTLPYLKQPNCLINITEKSYLDIFPRENLVYLSADTPKVLREVDPEKVYIVGAMCDKYSRQEHSFQKAKKENIPVYKLPLEEYFFFKQDRVLPMNLVIGILERYLEFRDWKTAFIGKVPVRKLKSPEELHSEQIRKVRKFYSKEKFFKIYKMNEMNDDENMQPSHRPTLYDQRKRHLERNMERSAPIYSPKFTPDPSRLKIKYNPNASKQQSLNEKSNVSYNSRSQSKTD